MQVLADILWAFASLSESYNSLILQNSLIPFLLRQLNSSSSRILAPALRTLGNIISGLNGRADVILKEDPNVLKQLFTLVSHEKIEVRKEACRVISKIASGRSTQVEMIIENLEYVQLLIKTALSDALEVKREAAMVFTNAMDRASQSQMIRIAEIGVLDFLWRLREQGEEELMKIGLNGIERFLSFGRMIAHKEGSENKYLVKLEEDGLIAALERLQTFDDKEMQELVFKIMKYTL